MSTRNRSNLIYSKQIGYFIILAIAALAVVFPAQTQAQACAESLRFSHTVEETQVDFSVLGDINEVNTFAWSFGSSCSSNSCFDRTGQEITVNDMFNYTGSTNPTIYLYEFTGNNVNPSNVTASTSKDITFGNAYYEEDRDGDGILNDDEEINCEGDPCPDCGDNGGGGGGGGGGGDYTPPSDGLVNCGRQTEVVPQGDGTTTKLVNPCGYDDLINLISILIQWLIGILVLVATLMFTYAGFLYLLADGNSDKAQDAKEIFTNVAFGFAIVLVSVLFITTVVTMFTSSSWEDAWMGVVPLPDLSMQVEELSEDDNVYS